MVSTNDYALFYTSSSNLLIIDIYFRDNGRFANFIIFNHFSKEFTFLRSVNKIGKHIIYLVFMYC